MFIELTRTNYGLNEPPLIIVYKDIVVENREIQNDPIVDEVTGELVDNWSAYRSTYTPEEYQMKLREDIDNKDVLAEARAVTTSYELTLELLGGT